MWWTSPSQGTPLFQPTRAELGFEVVAREVRAPASAAFDLVRAVEDVAKAGEGEVETVRKRCAGGRRRGDRWHVHTAEEAMPAARARERAVLSAGNLREDSAERRVHDSRTTIIAANGEASSCRSHARAVATATPTSISWISFPLGILQMRRKPSEHAGEMVLLRMPGDFRTGQSNSRTSASPLPLQIHTVPASPQPAK